jgi:hypothetical protein
MDLLELYICCHFCLRRLWGFFQTFVVHFDFVVPDTFFFCLSHPFMFLFW